jgi:hypothetical protein
MPIDASRFIIMLASHPATPPSTIVAIQPGPITFLLRVVDAGRNGEGRHPFPGSGLLSNKNIVLQCVRLAPHQYFS